MIIIAFLLIALATISLPMYNQAMADAQKSSDLADAREAASTLANALNLVYAGGVGSKQTIEYWLPEGVAAVYADADVDGVDTDNDGIPDDPSRNGRLDVQIWFDLNDDGNPDLGDREAVVVVETVLPSKWDENGALRQNWENEFPEVQDNFVLDPTNRTLHRATMYYTYDVDNLLPRRIMLIDEIIKVI
ncbi:MAG: hypothetical protein AVW06_00250 [Hadesarchaea archaeon DG-33-1]|nr:MAG: hypothetical protein AVW06_00250 [Hadesarchaea archaeon DG-33-1]